jgi:hypothetical protein
MDTCGAWWLALSDHFWSLEEIVLITDNHTPEPEKRCPYKKKVA